MKLEKEKEELKKRVKNFGVEKILNYKEQIKNNNRFKNFNTGLCFEVLHAVYSSDEICSWYDIYDCNDRHIETLIKNACKELGII